MLTLGLARSMDAPPGPRPAGPAQASAAGDDGSQGGSGAFWKVVATVATLILCWIGAQLLVVPTHTMQLQRLEANDQRQDGTLKAQDDRLDEVERQQAAEKAGRDELIALLRAEQAARRRRP